MLLRRTGILSKPYVPVFYFVCCAEGKTDFFICAEDKQDFCFDDFPYAEESAVLFGLVFK